MSIDQSLRDALTRLAAAETLLVALDFDGVVAPIVTRAEDARPLPQTAEAVARLAGLPRTWTAYVSGRALASLFAHVPRRRAPAPLRSSLRVPCAAPPVRSFSMLFPSWP